MWLCPNCNRRFKNPNQDHSCVITEADDHFFNKEPYVRDIYDKLMETVNKLKDIEIRYVKHGIMVSGSSTFLAIKPKNERLDIELLLQNECKVPQVYKAFRVSKNKIAHFIRLTDRKQIDRNLIKLIKESYKTVNKDKDFNLRF